MAGATPAAFAASLHEALKARLRADAEFTKVRVELVGSGDIGLADEALVLIRPDAQIEGTQEWAALGRQGREDNFALPARLVTFASGKQDSVTLQQAFDRAQALLDEVITELLETTPSSGVGAQTLDALVTSIAFKPFLREGGDGWALQADFSITYSARVT